ncbi:MAG: hypothetical protein FJ095_08610 [Deltaproteobacteria bacterium]|nr:hypothetical protein [Deltaproteobacteria bacterium]
MSEGALRLRSRELDRGHELALRLLGVVAVLSATVAQAIEAAAIGVWTGIEDLVNAARVLGAWSSQLFAVGGTALGLSLAARLGRSQASARMRALSWGASSTVAISVAIGSGALAFLARRVLGERLVTRLPTESALVLSMLVGLFAVMVAVDALGRPSSRGIGLALVGASAAVGCRALVVALQVFLANEGAAVAVDVSRGLSTFEWLILFATSLFGLAWLGTAASERRLGGLSGERLRAGALVVAAMTTACAGTLLAVRGQRTDARPLEVFLGRALDLLLDPSTSDVPLTLRAYGECLRWSVALLALLLVPRGVGRSAAVGFALIGGGLATSPAGALALGLAAWSASLDGAALGEPSNRSTVLAPGEPAD